MAVSRYLHIVRRDASLDVIRGIAVVLMMLSHVALFIHDGSNPFIAGVSGIGNHIAFIMFLFASGAATHLAYSHPLKPAHVQLGHHIGKRIAVLLAGYYIVAFSSVLKNLDFSQAGDIPILFTGVLIFQTIPSYAEFILPYILFTACYALLRNVVDQVVARPIIVAAIAVITYVFGSLLFHVAAVPFWLSSFKALFVGETGIYSFPVVQYISVFLIGYYWGRVVSMHVYEKQKEKTLMGLVVVSAALSGGLYIMSLILHSQFLAFSVRWPPSIAFLSYGMTMTLLLLYLVRPWVKDWNGGVSAFLGRNAFDLYITHILLLFAYERFIGYRSSSVVIYGISVTTVCLLSILLTRLHLGINFRFLGKRKGHILDLSMPHPNVFRKKYIAVLVVFLVFGLWGHLTAGNSVGKPMEKQSVTVPPVITSDYTVTVSGSWFLKGQQKSLEVAISSTGLLKPRLYYEVHREDTVDDADARSSRLENSRLDIPVDSLEPGRYDLLVYTVGGREYAKTIPFTVSYPLYIAWTFDWEGWDVPDNVLSGMEEISVAHGGVPYTHFYNPRILIPGVIPQERVNAINSWIRRRIDTYHDALGMHIHMFRDLVQAAAVTGRTGPRWGYKGAIPGYDVPMTAYTPDEIRTVLMFSKDLMTANGFPEVNGFRAGGWYANGVVLQVLHESGFTYDSSGHERKLWGGLTNSPWNLDVSSQPYYPSVEDQNIPDNESIGILEIPNNGGNTYDHKEDELLLRFHSYMDKGYLSKPSVLVYLSHPQWGEKEMPVVDRVLSEIDGYKHTVDQGPVLYVSMDTVYDLWK